MQYPNRLFVLAFLALGLITLSSTTRADINIGVVTSSTGPFSLVGIPQRDTAALLPDTIAGQRVRYTSINDRGDGARTLKAFTKLIEKKKVDAIIGPSNSGNAMKVIELVARTGTPMLAPVGSPAVILPMTPDKRWVFKTSQNDDLMATALLNHMRKTGVRSIAVVTTDNTFGKSWAKMVKKLTNVMNIEVIATEAFPRKGTLTTQQLQTITQPGPDAILIAAPGSAAVKPQLTLKQHGYTGQIYQSHGAAMKPFLMMGGTHVEDTIIASSLMLVLDEVPDSPARQVAEKYTKDYTKFFGSAPATFGANVYDAGLLLENAIPVALESHSPGTPGFRLALRDALENTRELPGTQGVYNMSPTDHSGFDERGVVLITIKNGQWRLL